MRNSTRSYSAAPKTFDPSSKDRNVIRLELIVEGHSKQIAHTNRRVARLENQPSTSAKIREILGLARDVLPWCFGFGMLAASAAGKLPWDSLGAALK